VVEIAVWNGKTYRRWPEAKQRSDRVYFQRSIKGGVEYLHRAVWESVNGEIPSGKEIHHIDEDPGNNDIANLECLTRAEHLERHPWSDDRMSAQLAHLDSVRHLTKAWHSSPEGIEEHRRIGAMAYRGFVPSQKSCAHCGCDFMTKKMGDLDMYCSNKCKSAARRASGVDNELRLCPCCKCYFSANRYSKTETCSRSCSNRYRKIRS